MTLGHTQRIGLASSLPLERAGLLDPLLLGDVDVHGESTAAHGSQKPVNSTYHLGDPGTCCGKPTIASLISDHSPSVCGLGGNDPTSRRLDEAARVIHHVAADCSCKRERIALLPFDQPSPATVPPQALTPRGLRRLRRGMSLAPHSGGSSSLGPALGWAERFAKAAPEHAAVVVFSDFLLTDLNPTQVLERLAAFPGYVHAVVLGSRPPAQLEDDERVQLSVITPSSPPGAVAKAVFEGLTRYRKGVRA